MKRESGNVGDFLAICICMLLMTILMTAYMNSVHVIEKKEDVNQIARKYILRMESAGYLTEEDRIILVRELEAAGVTEISLENTTMEWVGYGEEIVVRFRGKLGERYEIDEKLVSTAKY